MAHKSEHRKQKEWERRARKRQERAIREVLKDNWLIEDFHKRRDAGQARARQTRRESQRHAMATIETEQRLSANPGVPILVKATRLDKE